LWHAPIEAVQRRLRVLQPALIVRCAYLELTQPELPQCVAQLLSEGARHIRILPMFLGMGRHAREDLPAIVTELRSRHPEVKLEVLPALGEDPRVTEITCQIALDNLGSI
jgi:sirohydrochlorin cobaltochelatase